MQIHKKDFLPLIARITLILQRKEFVPITVIRGL